MLEAVTGAPDRAVLNLRVGGVCLMVGAVLFATVRLLHGDTPAADAEASLNFVQHRSTYAAVHVFAALIMLVTLTGLMALARSLTHPVSWLAGQSAVASALAGWAVFTMESTSEGLALPVLAKAAAASDPDRRTELIRAARAVAEGTYGPSLAAMALMVGVPLLLLGTAMALDLYPSWLGWIGAVIGVATAAGAVSLYLRPSLFPGFLLYGVLGSVIAQLWLAGTGAAMLRRSTRVEPRLR